MKINSVQKTRSGSSLPWFVATEPNNELMCPHFSCRREARAAANKIRQNDQTPPTESTVPASPVQADNTASAAA